MKEHYFYAGYNLLDNLFVYEKGWHVKRFKSLKLLQDFINESYNNIPDLRIACRLAYEEVCIILGTPTQNHKFAEDNKGFIIRRKIID